MKSKYLNLSLVFCIVLGSLLSAYPALADDPIPTIDFWNYPYDPSIFDWIAFGLYDTAPPEWVCHWDFGDGTTYDECWVDSAKQYNQDGDYTVNVVITSSETEIYNGSRIVSVRTHDVAITKFTVPQSARVGQTRQLVVNVRNIRYSENVQVMLYRNEDVDPFGTLTLNVPIRLANRTTAFNFNYTFTAEDAHNGKVTFRAVAILMDVRDAWPVDNEAISLPSRVTR